LAAARRTNALALPAQQRRRRLVRFRGGLTALTDKGGPIVRWAPTGSRGHVRARQRTRAYGCGRMHEAAVARAEAPQSWARPTAAGLMWPGGYAAAQSKDPLRAKDSGNGLRKEQVLGDAFVPLVVLRIDQHEHKVEPLVKPASTLAHTNWAAVSARSTRKCPSH
jgi:hypothetical protein